MGNKRMVAPKKPLSVISNQDPIPDTFGKSITKDKDGANIYAKTEGQKLLVDSLYRHDIIFASGVAGTGKTFLSIAYAIKLLRQRQVDKIILTRPPVEVGASIGYLPGDLNEKIQPYLRPFITSIDKILTADEKTKFMGKNIQIYPIGHMRGDTLDNCVVILDEAQNCEKEEIKMFLTRMGENSKYIITGDSSQTDLKKKSNSGFEHAISILDGVDDMIDVQRLGIDDVVRHGLIKKIIQAYAEE